MSAADIVTVIISSAALLISGGTLWWTINRAQREEPKIEVTGVVGVGLSGDRPDDPYWEFSVYVTNTGNRAVTIEAAAWQLMLPGKSSDVRVTGKVIDDETPLRLDANDSRKWVFTSPLRGSHWQGSSGRPAVTYIARPTWRERRLNVGATRDKFGASQTLTIPPDWA